MCYAMEHPKGGSLEHKVDEFPVCLSIYLWIPNRSSKQDLESRVSGAKPARDLLDEILNGLCIIQRTAAVVGNCAMVMLPLVKSIQW